MNNNEQLHQQRLYQFIILLAGILIAGSALFFLKDFQTQTRSAERELLGVEYVQKLQAAMFETQKVRGLYEILRHGDLGVQASYLEAQDRLQDRFKNILSDAYGTEIGINQQLRALQITIERLLDELSRETDPKAFQRFTHHIEVFRDLLLQTANLSHLALDTDIATFYLADISTNHLPSVVEAIGRLRGLGAGIIANGQYNMDEVHQLERSIEAVDLELAHVDRNLRAVFTLNPEIKSLLSERLSHIDKKVEHFTNLARSIITNGNTDTDALSFFGKGTRAVGICDVLCTNVRNLLKQRLTERINRLQQQAVIVGAGLSSAIILMVVLSVIFYRREHHLVQRLLDETHFSSALVDGLPSLFYLIDINGKFIRWNREFERISGYSSDEIARLHVTDLIVENQKEFVADRMASVSNNGSADAELDMLTKSSAIIPIYATGLRVELENRPYIVGFALDITKRKQMEEQLKQMAITDGLTGVFNRAKFNTDLKQIAEQAQRYQRIFSLIAIDIDKFKHINDTHGHAAGDEVIQDVVNIIKDRIRQPDSIYRYGGEEFHVILPETNLEGAVLQAERLRKVVAEYNFNYIGSVTISLGVAEYRAGEAIHVLLKRADDSLYAAKSAGRNRVGKNPG